MFIFHIGTIDTSTLNLHNTYYVANLTFNLASVLHLCHPGLIVCLSSNGCLVLDLQMGYTVGTGRKVKIV